MKTQKGFSEFVDPTGAACKLAFLGEPPVLEGEDFAAYEELLVRIIGDVKPSDVIGGIFVRDIVDDTWENFRWRRLKVALLSKPLFLTLKSELAPLIRRRSNDNEESGADWRVSDSSTPEFKLAKKWMARDPAAIKRVDKLLASAGTSVDAVVAKTFIQNLDIMERIDYLVSITEARRNAALRELDRHRESLARTLRERVQEVEEAEFKLIEQTSVIKKGQPDQDAA